MENKNVNYKILRQSIIQFVRKTRGKSIDWVMQQFNLLRNWVKHAKQNIRSINDKEEKELLSLISNVENGFTIDLVAERQQTFGKRK
jgi:hypothetical protein